MTLDEAIKHAEEVAEEKEQDVVVRKLHLDNRNSHNNIVHYEKACKCAEEHRQLAEWLKELKLLREPYRGKVYELKENCDMLRNEIETLEAENEILKKRIMELEQAQKDQAPVINTTKLIIEAKEV